MWIFCLLWKPKLGSQCAGCGGNTCNCFKICTSSPRKKKIACAATTAAFLLVQRQLQQKNCAVTVAESFFLRHGAPTTSIHRVPPLLSLSPDCPEPQATERFFPALLWLFPLHSVAVPPLRTRTNASAKCFTHSSCGVQASVMTTSTCPPPQLRKWPGENFFLPPPLLIENGRWPGKKNLDVPKLTKNGHFGRLWQIPKISTNILHHGQICIFCMVN